jgi:ribosomal protein S18 acetylase RimI-like enzyme
MTAPPDTTMAAPSPDMAMRQADTPEHVEIVRALFREYAEAIGTDLEYQGFTRELDALPSPYVPPKGALLLAYAGVETAGCVALRPIDDGVGEMKRLYVKPAYRKFGLGQRLVQAVIDAARAAGHRELRLDTLPSMTSAQALYRRLGFVEIPPYNHTHLPGTRCYSLELSM